KLEYLELLAVKTVPGLLEERGARRIEFDRKGNNEKHRCQKHDADDGNDQVKDPFRYALGNTEGRTLKLDTNGSAEPARRSPEQRYDILIRKKCQRQRQVTEPLDQVTNHRPALQVSRNKNLLDLGSARKRNGALNQIIWRDIGRKMEHTLNLKAMTLQVSD